jgi:hypothetical protein
MVVAVDSEISTEGHERTIYERQEFLTFGLAVATPPILAIRSELLGMTIGEYLKQRGTHGA